jgi:hypothetical protein
MCYLSYGETPLVNCEPRSYFHHIAITYLLYSHYLIYSHTSTIFHSIRSYPLFEANRWDWQPHRKLGAKYLVVLCAGSTLLLTKQSLDEAPYKLSGAVVKLASITFRVWLLPLLIDKPWFHNWGKNLAAVLIIPSSWGSQLDGDFHIYTVPHQALFLAPLPGNEEE